MPRTTLAYLLLGSNLGDRPALLATARTTLAEKVGEIVAASALYETAAWGREDQPAFLNQALAIRTALGAMQLLGRCKAAEQQAGRVWLEHWGSRTLDVDILLFGKQCLDRPGLAVPHPRLAERRFALVPLAEIAPGLQVPGLGPTSKYPTVTELLARCPDPLAVARWTATTAP